MTDFDLRAIKSRAEATARFARDFLPDLGLWGGDTSDIDQAFGPDTDSLQLIDKLAADVLVLAAELDRIRALALEAKVSRLAAERDAAQALLSRAQDYIAHDGNYACTITDCQCGMYALAAEIAAALDAKPQPAADVVAK